MTRNDLIAQVAADYVHLLLECETEGALRFCMVGLNPDLVNDIALRILTDPVLSETVLVRVPTALADTHRLPEEVISDESITYWRHHILEPGTRAVLFAASHDDLQRNAKSVEKVTRIETDRLRDLHGSWVARAGITQEHLDSDDLGILKLCLRAVNDTHAARTIETFADFVLSLAHATVSLGFPVTKAVGHALPALHLPRNSGDFDLIRAQQIRKSTPWAETFRRLQSYIRPFLLRENNKGESITSQLRENLPKMGGLPQAAVPVIEAFLSADLTANVWSQEQAALTRLDWPDIADIFEGVRASTGNSLGRATLQFFEDEFGDRLDAYRDLLAARLPKDASASLEEFFDRRCDQISRNKPLYRRWERYVFRNPSSFEDLLIGLIDTTRRLRDRTNDSDLNDRRRLRIRIPNADDRAFWRTKNASVVRYFAFRYRGISTLFGENVDFDFGRLYDLYFPEVDHDLRKITSRSKGACQLKFEVTLDPGGANSKLVFFWAMPSESIARAMPDDLLRVSNAGGEYALLPVARVARQAIGAKGLIQAINLDDTNSLRDTLGGSDGTLVNANDSSCDQRLPVLTELRELCRAGVLIEEQSRIVRDAFLRYAADYTSAIRDWVEPDRPGIGSDALRSQADAFGALLRTLLTDANNDLSRQRLWTRLLKIGLADVEGGAPAALVAPWHPLRLTEFHIKGVQAALLIGKLLTADEEDIVHTEMLFRQTYEELEAPYYPDLCIGTSGAPSLLSATTTAFGYTVAESPLYANELTDQPNEVYDQDAARALRSVCERYLALLPHEKTNFSILLYNPESNALPSVIASELSKILEQDPDLQCDVFLTHDRPSQARHMYEHQSNVVHAESSSVMDSEAAQNFLSRLRIGVRHPSEITSVASVRSIDVIFLQDVVARSAVIQWKPTPTDRCPPMAEHVPPRWSRKRPVGPADQTSTVYLTSPIQPVPAQAYLNAIHIYLAGENARSGDVIPAREISFQNNDVATLIAHSHSMGEWVVNYDEMVDRRLLINSDISVIRHIHDRSAGRNIVVSTTSEPRILYHLIRERISQIDPAIVRSESDHIVGQFIERANELSGQVVMRAARYGRFANELLGLVLSMNLISDALSHSALPIGWYFLDDYASWFGKKEGYIADILAIAPQSRDRGPVLRVVISEAKFVSSVNHRVYSAKSTEQLQNTVLSICRALDPGRARIDRDTWLHRLGDLLLEGVSPVEGPSGPGWDLHRWSDEIRQDNVPIELVGFSHIFVHDDEGGVERSGPTRLQGADYCFQQIFSKADVSAEIRRLNDSTSNAGAFASTWDLAFTSRPGPKSGRSMPTGAQAVSTQQIAALRPLTLTDSRTGPPPVGASPGDVEVSRNEGESTPQTDRKDRSRVNTHPERASGLWPSRALRDWLSTATVAVTEDDESQSWLATTVTQLRRALRGYGMTADLVGARLTPNSALVRFRGTDELTLPKLNRRRQELLTSHAIEVIDFLGAAGEIIVMVRRPKRAILSLRDLWCRRRLPDSAPESNDSLLIGAKESDGELLYLNVGDEFAGHQAHGPHTLIAGETGSGKGVLVQTLLLDICATNSPRSARIIMIDPKVGIDYPWLREMPHLDGTLVTDRIAATTVLENLALEMERRYRSFAVARVTKLVDYNDKVGISTRLPRIWLFHDELADWMLIDDYRDAVESAVTSLGVKARAAGINLVLVTQRPDKDALPMQLRANLTNRLVFKVADRRNSELVLDEPGAERLLGRGHLAARLSGEGKLILAQAPFATNDEIQELADIISRSRV